MVPRQRRYGCQRRLRVPLPIGQTEIPIRNVIAATVPFIRPGKDKRAGTPPRKDRADLPLEHVRLSVLSVATTVESDLPHEHRTVTRHVLQTRQVGLKAFLRLEVHIEAHQVQERQLQVLRGGIVHVRDQPFGVLILGHLVQAFKVLFHTAVPIPTDDRGRNLIANRIAQDGRVASAGSHAGTEACFDTTGALLVIEKRHMLFPRQPHHHPQPVTLCRIKQPARWYRIGADGIQAVFRHLGKVTLYYVEVVVLVAIRIRTKGSNRPPA